MLVVLTVAFASIVHSNTPIGSKLAANNPIGPDPERIT